jgi:chromosome segregation ATPase
MGLHQLIERLVRANVPMVFLDFPRIIRDGDYLFEKLSPFLPASATQEVARTAHRSLADPEKVRIEREVGMSGAPPGSPNLSPLDAELDRIALRRELVRLQAALKSQSSTTSETAQALRATRHDLIQSQKALQEANVHLEALALAEQQLKADIARRDSEIARLGDQHAAETMRLRDDFHAKIAVELQRAHGLERQIADLRIEVVRARESAIAAARERQEERACVSMLTQNLADLSASRAALEREYSETISAHRSQFTTAEVVGASVREEVASCIEASSNASRDIAALRELLSARVWKLTSPLRRALEAMHR